ncbi:hypothetical protein [Rhodanobacter ginsenosidimutans]|uniref:Copper resistance protein n=1 Tax=Rhodanobacter ginsenosidimutans TaxID=490571 RepID=A0ABW0JWW0_9GAMM
MARPFRMHRTTRRRLFWLVTLLMLWQQTALAAYVCPTLPEAATATALLNSMPGMDDGCAQHQESPASPLCQKHCAPERTTQVEAHTASVPLSPLPAMSPMLISAAAATLSSNRALQRAGHLRASPPPPILLFCSLLI